MSEAARDPYRPPSSEWSSTYQMLCGFCSNQLKCEIVERMIEMKEGGHWPQGGWVTDPGAGVTCLSYSPKGAAALPRQQLRKMLRQAEDDLPPVCDGCAARKGTEASISLHTRRDFQAAVANKTVFACHEDPEHKRLCGGWCRAVRGKEDAR
jgi:hypothetical protein